MADLSAEVVDVAALTSTDREAMLALMKLVYDGVSRDAFERDLDAKDEAIVLRTPSGELVGFSTQKTLSVSVVSTRSQSELLDSRDGEVPDQRGVFSGDTVIHPDHWGSPALMQAFSRRYIVAREEPFWWFLVSKGHRTYRFLPTFFTAFWPSRHAATPAFEQALMDAYATTLFGTDYVPGSGVLEYATPKDRLRPGVAEIGARDLRNPDIAFFAARNPGWALGHDLVCLCLLSPDNLRPRMRPILLGEQSDFDLPKWSQDANSAGRNPGTS